MAELAYKKGFCPICGKSMAPAYHPFCSKRCSDLDLGNWLDGNYAIPEEISSLSSGQDDDFDQD